MTDLREDLIRLAEEWKRKVDLFRKHHAEDDSFIWLLACLTEVEEILASHPAPSPSVSRDAPRADPLSRRRGINEARAAFERFDAGKPVRCIPATVHDDDMVLIDVLAEWEQMRWAALPKRTAPSPRSEAERTRTPVCYCGDVLRERPCPFCSPEAYYGVGRAPVPAESATNGREG